MQQLVMGETLSPKLAMSPPLGAADALSRSAYHASSEMMREGARFVGLRLQRYAELELALMRSPNIFASWSCMIEFQRLSMLDYTREMDRMPGVIGKMSDDALLAMESERTAEPAPVLV